jgi:hypothetical protein
MLYYNIRSKIGAFLVLAIMLLPCAHIVCMEPLDDNTSPSALEIITRKLEGRKQEWEQKYSAPREQETAALRAHFKTLDYIEDGADFLESVNIVRGNESEENSVVSPTTKEKLRKYTQASTEFGILNAVVKNFIWSAKAQGFSNITPPSQVCDTLQETVILTALTPPLTFSDAVRAELRNVSNITIFDKERDRKES